MNWRTLTTISAMAWLLLTAGGWPAGRSLSAEPSQATQPEFRAGIEILRLDVTAVDERGQPVRDLKPAEFSVTIDRRARPIRFAQFFGPDEAAVAPVPLPTYSLNTAAARGRVVVFAVDLISLRPGYEKPLLNTTAQLIESLGDNDAVGLMPIPGAGIDLTRERARVSAALRLLHGTSDVSFIKHYFTLTEAVAFERLDRRVMAETIERECCAKCEACPAELQTEARELLANARAHVRSVLSSLTGLANALRPIEAPRAIVLISAGLPFESESLSWFTNLQSALARAGITVHAVQVPQPETDASNRQRPGVGALQAGDLTSGLANVATMSGGTLYAGVGTATGVLDRLRTQLVYSYELGVEGRPTDRDGKAHDVKVTVTRPGVSVRSRATVVPAEPIVSTTARLGHLLAQPVDVTDLPIAATAYSVRGDEAATLKTIIAAQFGTRPAPAGSVQYAISIARDGKVVFQTNDTVPAGADASRMVTAAQLAPGRYRLRLAAVDSAGRGGATEFPVTIALRAAAPLQTSDVMLSTPGPVFAPVIRTRAGEGVSALIELYGNDPAQFASAAVTFELRKATDPAVISSSPGTLRLTSQERRQVATGLVGIDGLLPGEYSISAIISVDGKAVGRVSRGVIVDR